MIDKTQSMEKGSSRGLF